MPACPIARALLPMLIAVTPMLAGTSAAEARRSAIVVVNERTGGRVIPTARADGALVASTLREAEFDVLLAENVAANTASAVREFGTFASGSEIVLFYFVGSGVNTSDDVLLLPAGDADPKAGVSLSQLVQALGKDAKQTVVVIDGVPAVLSGAAQPRSLRPLSRTKANPQSNSRVLVSVSGSVPAQDDNGAQGATSVFATAFTNSVSQRGVPLDLVFRDVRRTVREATLGAQLPVAEGSVWPDLVLKPVLDEPLLKQPRPPLDQIFWSLIKGSADEADFKLFQSIFPDSALVERATTRRISLANVSATDVGRLTRSTSGTVKTQVVQKPSDLAIGASGDRAPPIQVRSWPETLPATPAGIGTIIKSCDTLAGDPDDPMRMTPGIQWGMINLRAAVRACFADLAKDPRDRRVIYLTGRLLDMMKLYTWADSFYRDAAELGYPAAHANLAYMYMTGRGRPVNMEASIPFLRSGAALGNPRCRTDLGFAYLNGMGVQKSTPEALLWLKLAASSGWPNAMDILANMYLNGNGVPADPSAAVELFFASAYVGNTNAMSSIGQRYSEGRGVEKNPLMAKVWFERAIATGNAFAPLYLGQMYRDGWGVQKSLPRAVEYMTLSADRGFGEARFRLAEIYEAGGDGVQKDIEAAAFNYSLTDRQSFEHPVLPEFVQKAKDRLKVLQPKLSPEQVQNVARRIDEYTRLNGP